MNLILMLALLGVAGDTPEEAFKALKKTIADGDWEAMYSVVSPKERKEMAKEIDEKLDLQ